MGGIVSAEGEAFAAFPPMVAIFLIWRLPKVNVDLCRAGVCAAMRLDCWISVMVTPEPIHRPSFLTSNSFRRIHSRNVHEIIGVDFTGPYVNQDVRSSRHHPRFMTVNVKELERLIQRVRPHVGRLRGHPISPPRAAGPHLRWNPQSVDNRCTGKDSRIFHQLSPPGKGAGFPLKWPIRS